MGQLFGNGLKDLLLKHSLWITHLEEGVNDSIRNCNSLCVIYCSQR